MTTENKAMETAPIVGPNFVKLFCTRDPLIAPSWLEQIYQYPGGYIFGSDGYMAVWAKYDDWREYPVPPDPVLGLPSAPQIPGEWLDPPTVEIPDDFPQDCEFCKGTGKVKLCPECNGDGELSFSTAEHTYWCECRTCDGAGVVADGGEQECAQCAGTGKALSGQMWPIEWRGRKLNGFLLKKLIDLRPEAQLFSGHDKNMNFLRFDDGHCLLMGLRD